MKNPLNSKFIWGVIASLVGVYFEAEFLRDGIQASDIPELLTLLGAVLAAFGIRNATVPLSIKAPVKLGFGSGKTGDK